MQTRDYVDFKVVQSNDLHPLARPLFDEAPHLPLANLLKGKGKYPSYNFLQAVHSLTYFQQERRR